MKQEQLRLVLVFAQYYNLSFTTFGAVDGSPSKAFSFCVSVLSQIFRYIHPSGYTLACKHSDSPADFLTGPLHRHRANAPGKSFIEHYRAAPIPTLCAARRQFDLCIFSPIAESRFLRLNGSDQASGEVHNTTNTSPSSTLQVRYESRHGFYLRTGEYLSETPYCSPALRWRT